MVYSRLEHAQGVKCMERLLRRQMIHSRLEHAQVMYVWRGPFNDMAGNPIEVGTCSGHVYMERPFQ